AGERGEILGVWESVLATEIGQVELVQLEQRAVKEAERIRRKQTRKPRGAAWTYWMDKHMQAGLHAGRWLSVRRGRRWAGNASGPPPGVP
ncbi:MAG: hypothetical protein WAW96_03835, partial [Alphaproteobacteria bacterium]